MISRGNGEFGKVNIDYHLYHDGAAPGSNKMIPLELNSLWSGEKLDARSDLFYFQADLISCCMADRTTDSLFPRATESFLAIEGVNSESKHTILWDNCARLYHSNCAIGILSAQSLETL